MDEIILHQYALSPFSEKVRRILAYKKIRWRAVEQPMMNPKPKLVPLTGGYRRIPVLQIGADVWCDTAAIARQLDRIRPENPCVLDGACEILAHWADHWLFLAAVPPTMVRVLPSLPPQFVADREKMSPGFSVQNLESALPDARSRLVGGFDWLESRLATGSFLLGERFSVADAACFHVLWFLRSDPESFAGVESRPRLRAWFERVEAIGPVDSTPLDPDEALAIARAAQPATSETRDGTDPAGIVPGDRITVAADDYGTDPISGTAVVITASDVALRRRDDSLGDVVVHFPRIGFRVTKSS